MISTLELKQFRGLEHVKFENLGRANLIIGGNNVGKTSILESLAILFGNKRQLLALPTTFRARPTGGSSDKSYWLELARFGEAKDLQIKADQDVIFLTGDPAKHSGVFRGQGDELSGYSGNWIVDFAAKSLTSEEATETSVPTSIISTNQIDPIFVSELFSQVAPIHAANEDAIQRLLADSVDKRLKRLRYAKSQEHQINLVHADLGDGPMQAFTVLGQAFIRTLYIYCEIFANRPKILLIEEIENGLYFEGMEDFWKGLMAVLEDQDVQLFATTHSRECMEAAHKAAASMEGDPLRFLRLDRRVDDPGKIVATTFGKEEMQTAIEFNREMR